MINNELTASFFDDHRVLQCPFQVFFKTPISFDHLATDTEKYVNFFCKTPKNEIIFVKTSAACKPTKFNECAARGINTAFGFIPTMTACTPLYFPAMFAPFCPILVKPSNSVFGYFEKKSTFHFMLGLVFYHCFQSYVHGNEH